MKRTAIKYMSILFLLLTFSCSRNSGEDYVIKYMMKKYEKKFGGCDTLTGECAKISLEYPEIKHAYNNTVQDSLTNYISETLLGNYFHEKKAKSVDEMAELFFKYYEDTKNDLVDYNIPWEINNTISVIYNDNSFVSFQSEFYHFMGGAHGLGGVYYANFNSSNGKKLMLKDFLVNDYENELNKIAEKIFRSENKLASDENLEDAGYWFENNKFSLNENFGIKNDGIIIYFNSYEIAPYAMGPTEILIPYSKIKNLVKKDGLLNKNISGLN